MARPATPMTAEPTSAELCADGAFSPEGAAAFTSLSKRVIEAALANGSLPFFKLGARVLIARVELVRWLAAIRDEWRATGRTGPAVPRANNKTSVTTKTK